MVQRADISNVLSEIRSLRAQMQQSQRIAKENPPQPKDVIGGTQPPQTNSFGSMLQHAIDGVNTQQQTANKLQTAYENGDPSADLTKVMIASEKANVSFQALTQVRNKVVQAYEDIMKMPL